MTRPKSAKMEWSPERLAIVWRDYPAGVARGDILARVNALPGDPVTIKQLTNVASHGGLKRPAVTAAPAAVKSPAPPVARPAAVPDAAFQAVIAALRENTEAVTRMAARLDAFLDKVAQRPAPVPSVWTPERDAILRARYEREGGRALVDAINALPGPPVTAAQASNRARAALHLRVADPRGLISAAIQARAAALRADPAAASGLHYSDARIALIRDQYPTRGLDILDELNALPGLTITADQLRFKAKGLRVRVTQRKRASPAPAMSAEREAVLRARYPSEGAGVELLAAVNALPGPVLDAKQIAHRARFLGLRVADRGKLTGVAITRRSHDPARAAVMVFPPARVALLRARYAETGADEALLAALNALPGLPVTAAQLRRKAKELGLCVADLGARKRRAALDAAARKRGGAAAAGKRDEAAPADVLAPGGWAAPLLDAEPPVAEAAPIAAPEPQVSPSAQLPQFASSGRHTAARDAVIAAEYAALGTSAAMMAKLNALPGSPITVGWQISQRAAALGVKRVNGGGKPRQPPAPAPKPVEFAAPAGTPLKLAAPGPRIGESPGAVTLLPVTLAQRQREIEARMIAEHIARKGVTRCPAAAVEASTADIPAADRAAVRAHDEAREKLARDAMQAKIDRIATNRARKLRGQTPIPAPGGRAPSWLGAQA